MTLLPAGVGQGVEKVAGQHLLHVIDVEELALANTLLEVIPGNQAYLTLSSEKLAVRVLARFQDANALVLLVCQM